MSLYKVGTAIVTNGSPTVTFSTDVDLTAIPVGGGDIFWITTPYPNAGEKAYRILSVNTAGSPHTATLTENYAGTSIPSPGGTYMISDDFTSGGLARYHGEMIDFEAVENYNIDKIEERLNAITTGTFSIPKEFFHTGQMTDELELRRNYVAKYPGTVNEVRIRCEDTPIGGSAIIRVQVGTGASPTKYVEITVLEGANEGVNNSDTFDYLAGEEIIPRCYTANQIGRVYIQVYAIP